MQQASITEFQHLTAVKSDQVPAWLPGMLQECDKGIDLDSDNVHAAAWLHAMGISRPSSAQVPPTPFAASKRAAKQFSEGAVPSLFVPTFPTSNTSSIEVVDANSPTHKQITPKSAAAETANTATSDTANYRANDRTTSQTDTLSSAAFVAALNAPPRRIPSPPVPPSKACSSCPAIDPSWPEAIVDVHFFGTCPTHAGYRKNELNFYCLGCGPEGKSASMCQYCVPGHAACCSGHSIQMYRYMYHDIIRVAAVADLLDLSGIQQYRANGHPAVHLRPMGPPANKSPYSSLCKGDCGRFLDPMWNFCSLSCKLGLAVPSNPATGEGMPKVGVARAAPRQPKSAAKGANLQSAAGSAGVATAAQSEEGFRKRKVSSWLSEDDYLPYSGLMRSRSSSVALKLPLVGAKKRKAAVPMRSPVL